MFKPVQLASFLEGIAAHARSLRSYSLIRTGPGRRTNGRTDFSGVDLAWRNRGLSPDSRESQRRARQAARLAAKRQTAAP